MPNTVFTTKSSASNMPRKVLFIVNPNAGKKISEKIIAHIRAEFPQDIYYQIAIWKNKNDFGEIIQLFKDQDYTDVVAVGGDGTVNEVAKAIVNTNIALGIVPIGSGNGLARSLGLSMQINDVIKQIVKGKYHTIDSGTVNGRAFFCTSGIGFDAHIGNLFATSVKRGLQSYVKITFRELFLYRAKNYTLKFNNQEIKRKAFLITVANAGQYGNDFYIAPNAKLDDGEFHVVILKPFNFLKVFEIFTKILAKKADKSSSIETYVTSELTVTRDSKDTIHFDGEPALEEQTLNYSNLKNSLKVIVGEKFKK